MIKILTTGGTIDNIEYSQANQAPTHITSLVPSILEKCNLHSSLYTIDHVFALDSRFIALKELSYLLTKIQSCSEEKIILTHGISTMIQTAEFLGYQKLNKCIVLTGASIPANKKGSDALFNLGAAFMAVQLLPHGVYIVMNGKVFEWHRVKLNSKTGQFEPDLEKCMKALMNKYNQQ